MPALVHAEGTNLLRKFVTIQSANFKYKRSEMLNVTFIRTTLKRQDRHRKKL